MFETCTTATVKGLKKGEFFKLKEDSKRVYIRGEYDRTEKKYCCTAWDDISMCRAFKGEKLVFVGFTF